MRSIRHLILLGLILVSHQNVHAQFEARSIVVSAPKTTIVAGERVPLFAVARDENGATRSDGFQWESNDEGILTVDQQGMVTARRVGTTNVNVNIDGAWTFLSLVVVPLRVDVGTDASEVFVGDTVQFTATARDINGAPIPDTEFYWKVSGPNGYYTQTASISQTGLMQAREAGQVTVKATLDFFGQPGQPERFIAFTDVVITRRAEFRLTRVLATNTVEGPFAIRQIDWFGLAGNDAGQFGFVSSLGEVTSGIVLYSNSTLDLLASAGTPGAFPGSFMWSFEGVALNDKGQVLSVANTRGAPSSLILSSVTDTSVVLVQEQTQGSFQRIRNFAITRYSLNDRGDIVFRGQYDLAGSPEDQNGIFKLSDGNLRVVWGTTLPLADFPDGYQFFHEFGVDGNGVVYFTVQDGPARAIYRADGLSAPQKLVSTGDSLGGSAIEYVANMAISPNGTVAFDAVLTDGRQGPARYDGSGNMVMLEVDNFYRVHSVNDRGEIAFTGDAGDNFGFYRWDGNKATALLVWGDPVGGGGAGPFNDAYITSSGTVYGLIGTTEDNNVVVETESRRVLFKDGDLVNASATLNFLGFVPGTQSGFPYVYTAGQIPSIFEVSPAGLVPVWMAGERPGGETSNLSLNTAARNPRGDLYLAHGDGVFRHTGSLETLVDYSESIALSPFQSITLDWTNGWLEGANYLAANDAGTFVWRAQSDSFSRLLSFENGRVTVLANFGGDDQTPAPGGGVFEDLFGTGRTASSIAMDDIGRVMVSAQVRDGPDGVYLYENGQWQTAALFDQTVIGGTAVNRVNMFRAAGERFFAVFDRPSSGPVLAEYVNQQWVPVIQTRDTMPNGADIYWVNDTFDVNRRGDIALSLSVTGGSALFLRTSDGTMHTVYRTSEETDQGDRFWQWRSFDLDLRDDGSLYFIGIDLLDRHVIYLAEPLF